VDQLAISFATPLRIIVSEEAPLPLPLPRLTIWCGPFSVTITGAVIMFTMPVNHRIKMQVSYVDAAGNPATVDGDVTWSTSDATIGSVTVDPADSTICVVTSLTKVGQVQITATADADLGEGTRSLVTLCDISIVAGEAVAGTIQPVGTAEPV
jgi:hypothetical protein